MKCFILQALVVLLLNQSLTFSLSFHNPYFLILNSEPQNQNVLIQTDTCTSGGYSDVPITLKSFCATGFWILMSEWCGNENSQKYFVAARDSCFELPVADNIKIKRFMPILQQSSDFDGHAFAWKDEAAYFIKLNDTTDTVLKPVDGLNKDWNILTVNQKFYKRYLHENIQIDKSLNTSRQCYSPESSDAIFQFYKLTAAGEHAADTILQPLEAESKCKAGYNVVKSESHRMTGTMYWTLGAETMVRNSTSSFVHLKLLLTQVNVPANGRQTSQCSDNSVSFGGGSPPLYKPLGEKALLENYPKFPHHFPPSDIDQMISEEIQETAHKYMDFELRRTKVPKVQTDRDEYTLLQMSSAILEQFCCHKILTKKTMKSLRLLLRFSLLYYRDYFPYEEMENKNQTDSIKEALTECAARGTAVPNQKCIIINGNKRCPETIESSKWNDTVYQFEMPEELQYELGNMDYVLETAWKSMLFVHYFCSSYFKTPSDHSAFNVKVESFFNPVMRAKWNRPQSVHRIYELLLNNVDLRKLGETIDVCVDTAHQTSEYSKWLTRPDADSNSRKKREVDGTRDPGECVPKNYPKVFCLDKQFDMIENNLVHPKVTSGECYQSYQNRAKYKYIHASKYGTTY